MNPSDKQQEMRQTIERLRKSNRSATLSSQNTEADNEPPIKGSRQRVSTVKQQLSPVDRAAAINAITRMLITGELSQGEALKALRIDILELKQDKYAQLVAVSRKTISDVENDKGNYSVDVMNRIFKPFGLKMGLVPISSSLLDAWLSTTPPHHT